MSKFFGRKASGCRKCNGIEHYVNKMGGISCVICVPPRTAEDLASRMTIEGGVWIDPANRFDMVYSGANEVQPPQQTNGSNSSNQSTDVIPPQSRRLQSSRGPGGELSEAEYELFSSAAIWGLPSDKNRNLDLVVTYGYTSVVWISEMFEASDDADRQRVSDASSRTLSINKERTAVMATAASASMFSV